MIALILDRSTAWAGLRFERDGKPVAVEEALREGFGVNPDDAPAVATLTQNFVRLKEEHSL